MMVIYQSVVKEGKGAAVSRLSTSILLIIPITRPYSLWNLRNYLKMRKLHYSFLSNKYDGLQSITSNFTNSKVNFEKL